MSEEKDVEVLHALLESDVMMSRAELQNKYRYLTAEVDRLKAECDLYRDCAKSYLSEWGNYEQLPDGTWRAYLGADESRHEKWVACKDENEAIRKAAEHIAGLERKKLNES